MLNQVADLLLYLMFATEIAVKIIALAGRPYAYFMGKEKWWNAFDMILVLACVAPVSTAQSSSLRVLRLVRMAKLTHKLPLLHMILMGLVGGITSIANIVALLFLVFYLFAVVGVCTFRGNDPWAFRDLPTALVTLFKSATLDGWSETMYVGIYGCDAFAGDGDLFSLSADALAAEGKPAALFLCGAPRARPLLASAYWVVFIAVCALVMLSLFVGAVTMSMSESMARMKAEAEESLREKRLERAQREAAALAARKEAEAAERLRLLQEAQADGLLAIGNVVLSNVRAQRVAAKMLPVVALTREQRHVRQLLQQAWSGDDLNVAAAAKAAARRSSASSTASASASGGGIRAILAGGAEGCCSLYRWRRLYLKLSRACARLDEHDNFKNFVMAATLASGAIVGMQTYSLALGEGAMVVHIIDTIVKAIFTMEVLVRVCAEELQPWTYFKSVANCFDALTAFGSYARGTSDLFVSLQLLRLLRLLKILRKFPQLQVIVESVVMSMSSIGYVTLILIMFFYFFAIIGMLVFSDNDPFNFGYLHVAMMTLFRCATLDSWSDVMYTNMLGCDVYGYDQRPQLCTAPQAHYLSSIAYFLVFIIIGALVLLTLFIGVVTTSLEEASQDLATKRQVERNVISVRVSYNIDDTTLRAYRRIFNYLDLDGSGTVGTEELYVGLDLIGQRPTQADLNALLGTVDRNGSGEVDFAEFLEFMMRLKSRAAAADDVASRRHWGDVMQFGSLGGAAADFVKSSHLGHAGSSGGGGGAEAYAVTQGDQGGEGGSDEDAPIRVVPTLKSQVKRTLHKLRTRKSFRQKVYPNGAVPPCFDAIEEEQGQPAGLLTPILVHEIKESPPFTPHDLIMAQQHHPQHHYYVHNGVLTLRGPQPAGYGCEGPECRF
ncbi:Ion transport protein-domain-containing protein [Tribonema minus]|uniref:Ion transport protein-domain-containing protein n=1 Tax=Tribonema minus TaxID=303371 RepID=A0A835YS85_9STRA|nr:Ion transport protein-domain-containing protein [Tribonema minus]